MIQYKDNQRLLIFKIWKKQNWIIIEQNIYVWEFNKYNGSEIFFRINECIII